MSPSGKLIIIAAPSGAGKTTVVKHLLAHIPSLAFSISACTRPIRAGEENGKDYYFLTPDAFQAKVANDDFVEWEMVYADKYYGTLKSELTRIWNNQQQVIFDVDVKGGLHIKQQFNSTSLAIFIKPPDIHTLAKRLMDRNTEDSKSLEERISKAAYEIEFADQFDKVIINNDLETTLKTVEEWVLEFLKQPTQ
jgi:guanylate kinase